jgi:hypothetical protein
MLRGRKGACSDLKDKKGISRIDFSIGPGFFFLPGGAVDGTQDPDRQTPLDGQSENGCDLKEKMQACLATA